jgi:tRNA 2-thiocytidine biosynthesis protein TtcA
MEERELLERELSREVGRCIADFALISEGDRVMVCLSGGKDSYTMLSLLERARRRAPIQFSLVAVHLDQGHPGYDGRPLVSWLRANDFEHLVLREDTYAIVTDKLDASSTYCSLCSRLRRGILYNAAQELGCTKIALGHHREDALETLLLNLIYAGTLKSMPPKLVSDDGRNVVIRPLLYCAEPAIARYAELVGYPILPCDLCGSQDDLKRKEVKRLLTSLEALAPRAKQSMLAALTHVRPSHLLDRELWSTLGLAVATESDGQRGLEPHGIEGERAVRRLPVAM